MIQAAFLVLFSQNEGINGGIGHILIPINILLVVLSSLYLFCNPFRKCRKFFQKRGEQEIHMYGETPFASWKKIAEAAELTKEDHFFDLGCGRGRLCFFNHYLIGCRATGVDWVPTFVRRARFTAWLFQLSAVNFLCKRLTEVCLEDATVIYLYTYHPDEERINFSGMRKGARVITVSEPLNFEGFTLLKELQVDYPWGIADVYISIKV